MSDDESFIVKPSDPAEIIRLKDSAALSEFLKDSRSVEIRPYRTQILLCRT
jgi:hypothetical protein